MPHGPEILVLRLVPEGDVDGWELERLALNLRSRLLELDVESVGWAAGSEPPAGAKSGGVLALGALAVSAVPVVWRGVVDLVQSWLENRPLRGVTVELHDRRIELTSASRAQQQQLVDAFLAAAAAVPPEAREAPQAPQAQEAPEALESPEDESRGR
jgi:hypothetical protein